jgi:hypothetical protein
MAVSVLVLLVIMIGRASTGSDTRADECTFPAANQTACTCTDGCADSDAFCGLLLSGFRISMMSALTARDGNCESEREHQQQN